MAHSVELLLDARHRRGDPRACGRRWPTPDCRSQVRVKSPTNRPHVTLLARAADRPEDVDDVAARAGSAAAAMRGRRTRGVRRSPLTLARLIVPSAELLELHAEILRISLPHLAPGAAPNTVAGQWTPHTTLARRVEPSQLAQALMIRKTTRDIRRQVRRSAPLADLTATDGRAVPHCRPGTGRRTSRWAALHATDRPRDGVH